METPREKRKKRKKRVVLAVSQKKNSQKGRSEERNQLTMAARQDNVYEDDTSEQLPLSEGFWCAQRQLLAYVCYPQTGWCTSKLSDPGVRSPIAWGFKVLVRALEGNGRW